MRVAAVPVTTMALAAAIGLAVGCQRAPQPPPPPPTPPTARPVPPMPAVGAVFLGGTDTHTCTGAVVHSAPGDLVLTAAHCLAAQYPATFVPGFDGRSNPADVWHIDAVSLDPRWVKDQDPAADYAFARVNRPAGGKVEAVAGGALVLGTAPAEGADVTITGYPLGVGGTPVGCRSVTGPSARGYPSLRCGGLVDGTSGAPWISGPAAVGVVGGLDGGGCDDSVSFTPRFDERTAELLARAEAGGPGDAPPDTFAEQC